MQLGTHSASLKDGNPVFLPLFNADPGLAEHKASCTSKMQPIPTAAHRGIKKALPNLHQKRAK
eukprot:2875124-Amphidinium_carterae.1